MVENIRYNTFVRRQVILGTYIHTTFWKNFSHQTNYLKYGFYKKSLCKDAFLPVELELVSKELNHLAASLHVYAGGFNFMK